MLLEDLRALFADRNADRLSSIDIVQALNLMEDRPWSEWRNGKPLSVRQLAQLLGPFKLYPTKFRAAGYNPGTRGYERSDFADAFARYLPTADSRSATAPQANVSAISGLSDPPQTEQPVADTEAAKVSNLNGCGVVADQRAQDDDRQEAIEERAAIMEFDGGLARPDAEALAIADVLGSMPDAELG